MRIDRLLVLPLLVSALAFAGCASSDDASDVAGDESNVSAAAPITLENFLNHPKIKAVRADVQRIDSANLTKAENPGCDGGHTKFTDAKGQIRKFFSNGGEGNFGAEETTWYADEPNAKPTDSRKVRFFFRSEEDFEKKLASQWRLYFDEAGAPIWQVIRTAPIEGEKVPDMTKVADRVPTNEERRELDLGHQLPEQTFPQTGCGTP